MESSVIKGEVQKLKNPKLEALYSIIKTLKTGCIVCMMYYGYTKWEKRSERKKLVTKKVETDGNYKFGLNLCEYKGCVVSTDSVASGLMEDIANFEVQDQDIFVASFPKSGTTWLQQVVYLLFHPDNPDSELMEWKFPYLEHVYPGLTEIDKRKNQQRFIKTHLPFHLLPDQISEKNAKIIYIHRDPKDMMVSYYFFARMLTFINYIGTLKDFAWQVMLNKVPYGPYFDHLNNYLTAAQNQPKKVLTVSYEDMKKDPEKVIQDIANFLKVPLTEERKITVAAETTFDAMKLNASTNYKHWDKYGLRNPGETEFMRKGEVGDHKNHFDSDMDKLVSEWVNANLEKYPLISQIKTNNNNTTTERCCSLQETDAET